LAGAWLLARENAETNRFYFHDYVAVLPDRANYSMAREVAREISHFDNLQATYIKAWPYWFDGNALRTTLQLPQFSLNPDVLALDPNQPPLSDVQGLVLFLVHPEDEAALQTLRSFFPHGVALPRYSPDGRLAFYAFYGER